MAIDATARVADGARIGDGVEIGPYCVVGPRVELKDGVRLIGQVNVTGVTTVGEGTVIYPFASLGTAPQSVHYRGEPTQLLIGARCEVREGVTMNIGTKAGGGITRVGERCISMAGSHVAQNASTAGMIYRIDEQLSSISQFVTLEPGDVVLTGSPAGVGLPRGEFLKPDDKVIATAEGVGELHMEIA